jgi:hypothetical protein
MRMPETLIPPTLAVVVLGLLASLGWGIPDFGGGLVSRTAPVLGILLLGQIAGFLISIVLVAVSHEPALRPIDLGIAALGGAVGAVGLAFLYHGLAVGRMVSSPRWRVC